MQLGERLRKLRTTRGLTQQQLAEPLYTHAHVSTIEAGRRMPSRAALEHFSTKLGVSPDELLTGRSPGDRAALRLATEEANQMILEGEIEAAEKLLRKTMRRARELALDQVEARAVELTGVIFEQAKGLEKALEAYEKAERLHRGESLSECAYAVAGQVRCHHSLGDIHFAVYVGERYLDELHREGLAAPDAVGRVLAPMVNGYLEAGAMEKAGEAAERVLELAPAMTDQENVAATYVNVARVQIEKEQFDAAERSLTNAEEIFESLARAGNLGIVNLAFAYVLARRDRLGDAEQRLKEARRLLDKVGARADAANAAIELGRVKRLQGDQDGALRTLNEALPILNAGDHAVLLAWGLRERARCWQGIDDDRSEKDVREAIALYERTSQPHEVAVCYSILGETYAASGRTQEACESFRTAARLIDADS